MLRHHSGQLSIPWGEMSIKEKDFILGGESKSSKAKGLDFIFGIILTHSFMTKEEEKHSEGSNDSVFGDSCQKGGEMSPKQKDRTNRTTTTKFKNLVLFKKYLSFGPIVFKRGKVVFQKWYIKTLLNTKRWISFRGSFVKSKEKHLKQGEKISNLENALQTLIHLPLTIFKKNFEKDLQKNLQKQNSWCKRGPKC
jgi:hypothetical protein